METGSGDSDSGEETTNGGITDESSDVPAAGDGSSGDGAEASSAEPAAEEVSVCTGDVGDEGCECYGNETCNGDLVCLSERCVDASAVSEGGDDGSGAAAAEGTSGEGSADGSEETPASAEEPAAEESGGIGDALGEALGADDETVSSEDLGMTPASVGQACESDDDCGDGVVCLIEDELLQPGQIVDGMCTLRCEQDPYVCGGTAICLGVGQDTEDVADDVGYCYELCLFTEPVAKCQGSVNRVCSLIDPETGLGVCDPKCFSDGECSDGSSCAPRYPWTCVDELPEGLLADGETCTENEECEGGGCIFIDEASTDGICISDCSLQSETYACGRDLGDTAPVDSACFPLLGLLAQGATAAENDLGQCLPTCDPAQGCGHPEWDCVDLEDDGYTADVGVSGACLPVVLLEPAEAADAGAP